MDDHIIQHSKPTLCGEEVDALSLVIKSGHIAQGDKVEEFEDALARFAGVKGAVALSSGTAALHLGLLAMGVSSRDEVLLPSYVCTAPLNAVHYTNGRPRLCDIELESFNISLESIEEAGTEDTKAVIVPHMFGNTADLERIEEAGIAVIEDCAQSVGAMYGEVRTGSFGRFSIMSFYATKMMACGEGGALLSNDEKILMFARDMRDYDEKDSYKVRYNYKMTDVQAAMGLVQMKKLPGMIQRRKEIASRYDEAFKDLEIILPKAEFDHVYYRYVIRTEKPPQEVISSMKEKGIICARPVFNPLNRYLEMRSGFRNTDEVFSSAVSIPIYPALTGEEEKRIIEGVKESFISYE